MNKKGQSVLAEHVAVFFIVIAALVAMSVFVQRSLQAKIRDMRDYAVNAAANVCDQNCLMAAGGVIRNEYEPYYVQLLSSSQRKSNEYAGRTAGKPTGMGVIYYNTSNEQTDEITTSTQLPSACADNANPRPTYCDSL